MSSGRSAMAAQDIRTGPPTGWFGGLRASAGQRSAGRQDHVLAAGHRHVYVDVPGLGDAGHRHGHGDRRLQFTLDHDAGHRVEPGGHQRGGPQHLELEADSRRFELGEGGLDLGGFDVVAGHPDLLAKAGMTNSMITTVTMMATPMTAVG